MVPAVLPHLMPWSKNPQNRCEYDDIFSFWTAHDAITFLIDLEIYHWNLHDFLTKDEKAQLLRIQSLISRQRFVVSRIILKHILSEVLLKESINDIILMRCKDGGILVKDTPHVYISLSYYGTSVAITVGKRKLGNDIEGVRPVHDKKITASPIFRKYSGADGSGRLQQVIHVWTLVESYAKLHDKNPYPLLNDCSAFRDVNFVSYCINQQMILTLASNQKSLTELLVWLDIEGIGTSSSG